MMMIKTEGGLMKKQRAALKFLLDNNTEAVLYGGAIGGGKSWLGCWWLWYMCRKWPNTVYFLARRQMIDINRSTLGTFYKVLRAVEGKGSLEYDPDRFWRYSKGYNTITHRRNGAQIVFVSTEYLPADPNFDRLGSTEYTGGWFEEAQETSRRAYDVLCSRAGRQLNKELGIKPKILLTCNPAKNWLYTDYYLPHIKGELPKEKKVVLATLLDNKHLAPEYKERLEKITDVQLKQRLIDGNWDFEEEGGFLISPACLANCISTLAEGDRVKIGIDVALNGERADKTEIAIVQGNSLIALKNIDPLLYTGDPALFDFWLADQIREIVAEYPIKSADDVRIDAAGVGSSIYSILNKMLPLKVFPFKGALAPFPRKGSNLKFWNLKAQSWWEAKEKIRLKKIKIPADYDEELWQELTAVKYTNRNDTIGIEDKSQLKRRLGRSPDKADAFILALFDIPEARQAAKIVTK